MNLKIRTLVGILVAGIVLVGGWRILSVQMKKAHCSEVVSILNTDECIGERVEAIGILECTKPGVSPKAGVHYLKFEDGTELRFLEEYVNCESYDGKTVRVIGEFYQSGELDQSTEIGLANIESVSLAE